MAPPGRTILAIEDDPALLELLTQALGEEGYRVIGAPDLAAAAATSAHEPVALILTDALRTLANGVWADPWAALAPVRTLAAGAPVVIVTGQRPADYADWAARGFAGLLPKPFDLDTLFALVRTLLGDTPTRP